jgi:hypothetical protein
MFVSQSRVPSALMLILGIFTGWGLATCRPAPLHASAGDRSGECIVTTGPVLIRWDESAKSAVPTDAVYFLDYKGGRLLATVPTFQQTTGNAQLLDQFSERDLVADFKLDLDSGPRPQFLMTTASLGANNAGWAPLYVFETKTSQMAVYRMQIQQTIGTPTRPRFDLVELRSYAQGPGGHGRP